MAKKKGHKVTAYYRKLHLQCIQSLEQYLQSGNKEAMHELRVSLKKLDALFWLANKLLPDFKRRKLYSTYHNLFKRAGIIRDAQVQLELLETFDKEGDLAAVSQHLKNEITDQHQKLVTAAPDLQLQLHKLPITIPPYFNQIQTKAVAGFTEKLIKKQEKNWKEVPSKKNLHSSRKPIKHLLYIDDFLLETDKKLLSKKQSKHWDKLQQRIGDYHDCARLLNILKGSKQKDVTTRIKQHLKGLDKQIAKMALKVAA
ncbi:MAG: CHAD domain-containing protein [Chitinophagales bacterium]